MKKKTIVIALVIILVLWCVGTCVLGVLLTSHRQVSPDMRMMVLSIPTPEAVYLPLVVKSEKPWREQFADILVNDPRQQRPELLPDPVLMQVAQEKAEDMRDREYYDHITPEGVNPNLMVLQAGFPLPSFYDKDSNNVESIAGAYNPPDVVYEAFISSPPHRAHLLGELPFFQCQNRFGIGYAEGGFYHHYWVVIIAERD